MHIQFLFHIYIHIQLLLHTHIYSVIISTNDAIHSVCFFTKPEALCV